MTSTPGPDGCGDFAAQLDSLPGDDTLDVVDEGEVHVGAVTTSATQASSPSARAFVSPIVAPGA